MDDLARRLTASPSTFPHALDDRQDMLLLVELSEAELARASFLDQRVLTPTTRGQWVKRDEVQQRIGSLTKDDAHYIFHIGHVGSTLISRMVGEIGGTLALREPLVLRDLVDMFANRAAPGAGGDLRPPADMVGLLRILLSRTFRADQRAIIKATSFVSEIAERLVSAEAKAILISVSPESYMTTILAGEASRRELDILTPARLARLSARLPDMPYRSDRLDEGARVALAWLTESLSLRRAADLLPPRAVLWIDFDRFLADPFASLLSIASHFGLALSPDQAATIIRGPVMNQYSKAPEHRYNGDLRRQLQQQAWHDHRETIRHGMHWLDEAMQRFPGASRATLSAGTII